MTAVIHSARREDSPQQRQYRQYRRGAERQSIRVCSEPDYVARRFVAIVLVAVVFTVVFAVASVAVSAAVDSGGRPAVASDFPSAGADIVRTHVAQPGDTLWSIADVYRGDVGQGRFVDALIDANGGTVIQIGQAVRLP